MPDIKKQNTAACSFLGQTDVCDMNLDRRLLQEMYTLAEAHEAVEFLLQGQGSFFDLCFLCALRTKQRFPGKQITLTLVQPEALSEPLQHKSCNILDHFADRILTFPRTSTPGISKRIAPRRSGARSWTWGGLVCGLPHHIVKTLENRLSRFSRWAKPASPFHGLCFDYEVYRSPLRGPCGAAAPQA